METEFYNLKTVFDRVIPEFIKDDSTSLFTTFLEYYYEYLDTVGNAGERTYNLLQYRDIDETDLTEFLTYFRKTYIDILPVNYLADSSLLIKNIKSLYGSKGTEKSFKFLFRVLYNQDVNFYYPKDDLLRPSDGKWVVETSLKCTNNTGNFGDLVNRQITGLTSGATGIVEYAVSYELEGVKIAEFFLSSVKGTFLPGRLIAGTSVDGTVIQERSFEVISGLTVVNGGSGYKKGDKVYIVTNDSNMSILGFGVVTALQSSPISSIGVLNGGSNYNGNYKIVTTLNNLPMNSVYNNQVLLNQVVSGLTSTDIDYLNLPMNSTITSTIINGTGDIVSIIDNPGSTGNGATAVVDVVDNAGAIITVKLISAGKSYETPTATVTSATGTGAILSVSGGTSAISSVVVQNPAPILTGNINDYTTDTIGYGNNNATFSFTTSALVSYPGKWLTDDSKLDSTKKLQDNEYWQEYSYVLKSELDTATFADAVKPTVHPAGMKMFGEVNYTRVLYTPITLESITGNTDLIFFTSNVNLYPVEINYFTEIETQIERPTYLYELTIDEVIQIYGPDIATIATLTPGTAVTTPTMDSMQPNIRGNYISIT